MTNWKKALAFITLILLSVMGVKTTSAYTKTATATQEEEISPPTSRKNGETLLSQRCPESYQRFKTYGRVITRAGNTLNIRSKPNGKIIGEVPSGWTVVLGGMDATRRWVRITSHQGERGELSYASAPKFRRGGWVAREFMRPLGRFCQKPIAMMRLDMNALSGEKKILVNEDWTQLGDRISKAIPRN